MYLTVTANPALDRVMFIDRFIPGTTMRPKKMIECVGGKGMDSSVVLRTLGQKTLALGFIAGNTGAVLQTLLDNYGIDHNLIPVEGETRIAHVIVETIYNRHSHIIAAGHPVSPSEYSTLLQNFRKYISKTRWVIAAGSLPQGVPVDIYQTLIGIAKEHNIPTLIDCSGEPALAAIVANPAVLKMNQSEFGQTFDVNVETMDLLQKAARQVYLDNRLDSMVITCGEKGILAFTRQGFFWAAAPQQVAVNAAGAGDGASASLAWRLSLGDSWQDALRWAVATSAAVVLTEGTADCNMADIKRIFPNTKIQNLDL